jgi:putative colanic acid biosynthesis UDP-glucose lipid carrier transferase
VRASVVDRPENRVVRHKVKPGITGWAQINGWRGEADDLVKMQGRVEHDLLYVCNWSLWLELKIVLLTAVDGFTGAKAH